MSEQEIAVLRQQRDSLLAFVHDILGDPRSTISQMRDVERLLRQLGLPMQSKTIK